MRVLFTTHPGRGHLHPMIPLARALTAAGHEVAFATARSFLPAVAFCGFQGFPAGLDWLESEAAETLPADLRSITTSEDEFAFLKRVFADQAALSMLPDLLAIQRDFRPDVLVRNDFEFAATIVSELTGVPVATVGIDFFMPPHVWRSLLGPQLARLRRTAGLPAQPPANQLYRYLYLSLTPPRYGVTLAQLPEVARVIRPQPFDASAAADPPDLLTRLAAEEAPIVYFTLGTIFNRHDDVFRTVIAGLADLPVRVIVSTGRGEPPAWAGEMPANVTVARYVPQVQLIERSALVITHGGFNTLMAAFCAGVPVLVTPISAHHPVHAARCRALGLGAVLAPRGRFDGFLDPPAPPLEPERVRATVLHLLTDSGPRSAAQALAREIRELPGPEDAVPWLEWLGRERRPLLKDTVVHG